MSNEADRILKHLDMNGILTLSEIAEYSNIKAVEARIILDDLAETGLVYYVGNDEWSSQ